MVLIFTLLLVYTVTVECADNTRLFHEHGFLLKDQGIVYLDTNEGFLSVFVNIALPQFQFYGIRDDCVHLFKCGHNRTISHNCQRDNWSGALQAENMTLSVTKTKIKKLGKLLQVAQGRSKRNIAGFLGLG